MPFIAVPSFLSLADLAPELLHVAAPGKASHVSWCHVSREKRFVPWTIAASPDGLRELKNRTSPRNLAYHLLHGTI